MSTGREPLIRMCRFLDNMSVATLATVDDTGMPYAVSLYMASDGHVRLYFVSDPCTKHCRHVEHDPHVHVTAYAPNAVWMQTHGILVGGICERVNDRWRDEVGRIYCQRFPFATDVIGRNVATAFYCITPSHIRWIDNRVDFGFKADFIWPLPRAPGTPVLPPMLDG